MKQYLKQRIEESFEKAVLDAYKDNPLAGSPFEGMFITSAIANTTQSLKETLNSGVMTEITEKENLIRKLLKHKWTS